MRNAAIIIQKHFRGHRVRMAFKKEDTAQQQELLPERLLDSDLGAKIKEARQKVKEAQQNASEDMKLGNRTAFALDYLYKNKDMAYLIQAILDLGNYVVKILKHLAEFKVFIVIFEKY